MTHAQNHLYSLTSPQREIWFDQILHSEVPLYNIAGYIQVDGPVAPPLFEQAINQTPWCFTDGVGTDIRYADFSWRFTLPLNQPIGLDWDDAQWTTDVTRILERLLDKKLPLSLADFQNLEPTAQLELLHKTLADSDWDISKKQLQGLKTFKANCQTEYVPQDIQSVPISLFIAEEILTETASGIEMERLRETLKQEADWGWSQYASGIVDIYVVPGNHHTMMSQPHVQVLAEKLKKCLDNEFCKFYACS